MLFWDNGKGNSAVKFDRKIDEYVGSPVIQFPLICLVASSAALFIVFILPVKKYHKKFPVLLHFITYLL